MATCTCVAKAENVENIRICMHGIMQNMANYVISLLLHGYTLTLSNGMRSHSMREGFTAIATAACYMPHSYSYINACMMLIKLVGI